MPHHQATVATSGGTIAAKASPHLARSSHTPSALPRDIDPELLEFLNEPLPFEKPLNKRTQQERSPEKMDVGMYQPGRHAINLFSVNVPEHLRKSTLSYTRRRKATSEEGYPQRQVCRRDCSTLSMYGACPKYCGVAEPLLLS